MRQSRHLGLYNGENFDLKLNELAAQIAIQIFDHGDVGYEMSKARNNLYRNHADEFGGLIGDGEMTLERLMNISERKHFTGICDCSSFVTTIWAFAYLMAPRDLITDTHFFYSHPSFGGKFNIINAEDGDESHTTRLDLVWMRDNIKKIPANTSSPNDGKHTYNPENFIVGGGQHYWNAATSPGNSTCVFSGVGSRLQAAHENDDPKNYEHLLTKNLQPGDIFEETYGGVSIGHVLMYIGPYTNEKRGVHFNHATIECGGADGGISSGSLKIKGVGPGLDSSPWKTSCFVYRHNSLIKKN